jgi:hypothetical protein
MIDSDMHSWKLAPSRRVGQRSSTMTIWQALWCGLLISVLLLPAMVSGFDHHGAERIPTHGHWPDEMEVMPAHEHGFERPHQHSSAEFDPASDEPAGNRQPAIGEPESMQAYPTGSQAGPGQRPQLGAAGPSIALPANPAVSASDAGPALSLLLSTLACALGLLAILLAVPARRAQIVALARPASLQSPPPLPPPRRLFPA